MLVQMVEQLLLNVVLYSYVYYWNYLHWLNVAVDVYDDRNNRVRVVAVELNHDVWLVVVQVDDFQLLYATRMRMEVLVEFYLYLPLRESFLNHHLMLQLLDSLNDWLNLMVIDDDMYYVVWLNGCEIHSY